MQKISFLRRLPKNNRMHAATSILVLLILVGVGYRHSSSGAKAEDPFMGSGSGANLGRSCTSTRTLFQDVWTIPELNKIFQENTSKVVEERLKIFNTPSSWVCPKSLSESSAPPMPKLTELAGKLPGWSYEFRIPFLAGFVFHHTTKPVTFENFSSILSEFR